MKPNARAFPDELLEYEVGEEDIEVEEEMEPDTKLEGGHIDDSPGINEIMYGEVPGAISDLWRAETNAQ